MTPIYSLFSGEGDAIPAGAIIEAAGAVGINHFRRAEEGIHRTDIVGKRDIRVEKMIIRTPVPAASPAMSPLSSVKRSQLAGPAAFGHRVKNLTHRR